MLELPAGAWFIVGCQRSGTTLLRLVLDSHDDLRCIDETLAHEILACRADVPRENVRLGFKLPRFTEQLDSPAPKDYFIHPAKQFYTGQPIIFLRRDPRDVVASMMRLNDGAWFRRWVRAILDEKFQEPAFEKRYSALRQWCEKSECPDAAVAALYWRYKNDAYEIYRARDYPVHLVSYEDLVTAPAQTLMEIVEVLGVSWQPETLLRHFTFEHRELMADGNAIGGTDPKRPIDESSVGSWIRVLDAHAEAVVTHVAFCKNPAS